MPLSRALSTIPQRRGSSWICSEAKGNNKVESKLGGLAVLENFVVSALSLLRVIGGFKTGLGCRDF